jgi:hypothetical protein
MAGKGHLETPSRPVGNGIGGMRAFANTSSDGEVAPVTATQDARRNRRGPMTSAAVEMEAPATREKGHSH